MNNIQFQHTDAWIYLCIPHQKPGATREDIISSADHINQAIPTTTELEGALDRGIQSGLLINDHDHFYFSPEYSKTIQGLTLSQKNVDDKWNILEQFLSNLNL